MDKTYDIMENGRLIWSGRIISAIACLPLIYGTLVGLFNFESPINQEMIQMEMPPGTTFILSVILIPSLTFYAMPRTSLIGAILLTGYMGGAIVSHFRVGEPFIHAIVVPILIWVGLSLRESKVRQILNPFQK